MPGHHSLQHNPDRISCFLYLHQLAKFLSSRVQSNHGDSVVFHLYGHSKIEGHRSLELDQETFFNILC